MSQPLRIKFDKVVKQHRSHNPTQAVLNDPQSPGLYGIQALKDREKERVRDTSWEWELAAFMTCVTSFAALVIVLSFRNGNPPPNFPLGITLNTVVAIFSTVLKTAMLYCAAEAISQSKWIWFRRKAQPLSDVEIYDQASRGPWGALMMLSRIHWR